MAIKVDNSTVSDTAWGDVDRAALGKRLAQAYADGTASKAVLREAYAFVPDEAFGKDADGNPTFAYTKAWGPHHELKGDSLVLNRNGVHAAAGAAAGARSEPSLSAAELAKAKRHLRGHYRALKEEAPASLKESSRRVGRGKPLTELVKGSLDYTMAAIRGAFYQQFPVEPEPASWLSIEEIFADHVVVHASELTAPDEYYYVTYQRQADGSYVFSDRETWEIVELTYQPQTVQERQRAAGRSQRFVERLDQAVALLETAEGQPRRIRAIGITADVVNGNGRRYAAAVLRAAVADLKTHLHESAGQGRAVLLGEAEHPSDKGGRPSLLETVVKWEAVEFDGRQVVLEGAILPTSKGKDILTLMEGNVLPGVSQRGYGESRIVREDGRRVEEIVDLTITGYDLVLEPSDPAAGVTMFESQGGKPMKLDLETLREEYPDLVTAIIAEHDEKKRKDLEEELQRRQERDAQVKREVNEREKALRQKLGLGEGDDLVRTVEERTARLAQLEEQERVHQVAGYIEEQMKSLKYPDWLKEQMGGAIKEAAPKTVDEAKTLITARRKEYDGIMAKLHLAAMGHRDGTQVLGPVLEQETGVPAYASAAFQLQESLVRAGLAPARDLRTPKSVNERFAAEYLARYDQVYKHHLVAEAKLFDEAEQATDLSLPYSVMRTVIAVAIPKLVATSIFDVAMTDQATTRIYYEAYSGETGSTAVVTAEVVVADHDTWVAGAYGRVKPGTVVVTNSGATVTYSEGDDYVIDYAGGKLMALSTGLITDGQSLKANYTYYAYRKGEMTAIERGKMTLSYVTLDMAADRLATQISREAIVFSRAQIGWDAVGRTLTSLVTQIQRRVDEGLLYLALANSLKQASNSGGTWNSAAEAISKLVEYIGLARVKVGNRYYEPTAIICSLANSDRIANWDGFTAAGQRPDADLNANGYVGRLKGLPMFETTEFSDSYIVVCNREIVSHRVFQPMQLIGPFPTYDVSGGTSKLLAADQYYAEEFNGSVCPVPEKAAHVIII